MEFIRKIVTTLGVYNIIRFLLGALVAAYGFLFGRVAGVIAIAVIFVLSSVWEYKTNPKVNIEDIRFVMLGCLLSILVYLIFILQC